MNGDRESARGRAAPDDSIKPGLVVLHGNRLELLRDAVVAFLARHPLQPLETEVLLVQSNGAAEWLKMALAQHSGICAATRVELPARFLWRSYRRVLAGASSAAALPARSPLDPQPLTWRLMRLLPQLRGQPGFEPISVFLQHDADPERRLQLATRLADLFDQYQVYRADWLDAWASGNDTLPSPLRHRIEIAPAVPDEQRWQPMLWRALLAGLTDRARATIRPQVHGDFIAALAGGGPPPGALPRRVVLFGTAHVPGTTLQALTAIAAHSQVLLAVPNPCRFHWADIIEGRELLRAPRQRLQPRPGAPTPLSQLPLSAMHAHAHPLLAAWGRQGRDFMRQLDRLEDQAAAALGSGLSRVDWYDDGDGETLLQQVQAAIRDLLPLAEHPARTVRADDRSIVFHVAHGALREVEILHDRLLDLLAERRANQADLQPRDIVVMVPDIESFAPAIRAVFGALPRHDPRFIPFEIADLQRRDSSPLLQALEWLLRIRSQRVQIGAVFDLLDVPAIATRFGLQAEDLPQLRRWAVDAGVRWGLHAEQRAALGLGVCGELNSFSFGLRRMLLGFANGAGEAFGEIEPLAEVGGLQAALLGGLADLIDTLDGWWQRAGSAATPQQWAERCRHLLDACVQPSEAAERLTLAALQTSLADWLEACDDAGFDEPVALDVLREAWLGGVETTRSSGRFLAGGVTFCTLLPLRAVPFEVVCLLGMNDTDYPRPAVRNDFDLMALAGQTRPGDRSRRDDDRYLMLEALLSARRTLLVSWAGRSVRDHSEQRPSVLVSQLRDYLAAGWQGASTDRKLLHQLSTEHPLQPFSRRYFEAAGVEAPGEGALDTWASEWRALHVRPGVGPHADFSDEIEAIPTAEAASATLDRQQLVRFLRNPVRAYFRQRLDVVFDEIDVEAVDEPFGLAGLERHGVRSALVEAAGPESLPQRIASVRRQGLLPLGEPGVRMEAELQQAVAPMWAARAALHLRFPTALEPPLRTFEDDGLRLQGASQQLRVAAGGGAPVWVATVASQFYKTAAGAKPRLQVWRLLDAWVRLLLDASNGDPALGYLIGVDCTLCLQAPDDETASEQLRGLLALWRTGMQSPLPVAPQTAFEWLDDRSPAAVCTVYEGGRQSRGEGAEPCLARLFPTLDALQNPDLDPDFETLARRLYGPLHAWAKTSVRTLAHDAVVSGSIDG
ncbi:MAG: exodeoxyribonuclease V subunit gamma [Rubrivivax sp.]